MGHGGLCVELRRELNGGHFVAVLGKLWSRDRRMTRDRLVPSQVSMRDGLL